MHIAWINEFATLKGGAERYIRDTAILLRERGWKGTLLHDPKEGVAPEMALAFDAVLPWADDLASQLRSLQPDLAYAHTLPDETRLPNIRTCGRPVARFVHDHRLFCLRDRKYTTIRRKVCTQTVGMNCYPCLGFVRKSDKWPGVKLVTVKSLRGDQDENKQLAAILAGSAYMREHVIEHGFRADKVHYIPLYTLEPEGIAQVPREADLIVFVGQLIRGKALDVLLKALSLCQSQPRLLVLGQGNQEAEYRQMAKDFRLGERVIFGGVKSRPETFTEYRRAALVAYPSRNPETFGLVGPEAMSQATPLVSTCIGGMGEWARHGETALTFPVDDAASMARAIDRLIGQPEQARQLGQNGRRLYEELFRPETHLAKVMALFESLATAKQPAGVS